MTPGSEVQVVVKGKAATIDLVEGEQRVLELKAAEGRDRTEPGWEYPRQFALRVVRVSGGGCVAGVWPRRRPAGRRLVALVVHHPDDPRPDAEGGYRGFRD